MLIESQLNLLPSALRPILHIATTLAEALETVAQDRIDVAVLDLGLPDSTGIDSLHQLVRAAPELPIVVLSSTMERPEAGIEAIRAGAEDYLPKTATSPSLLYRSLRLAIERRAMRTSLEQRTKALQIFAMSASHDLAAPMRRIVQLADLIEQDTAPTKPVKDHLHLIRNQAQRAHALVQRLRELAEHGVRDLTVDDVPVAKLTEESLTGLDEIHAGLVQVDAPHTVRGDPVLLRSTLTNLVDNAIKYGQGAPITVTTRAVGGRVTIEVRDEGPGIPSQYLTKVTEPFFRIKKHDAPGSGLGLAIVRAIIEAHGSSLQVESTEGQGTAFRWSLPAVMEAA